LERWIEQCVKFVETLPEKRQAENMMSGDRRKIAMIAAAYAAAVAAFGGCAGPKASYYGSEYHGRITASGERFDMNAMTAAHRSLPFGTRVRVTNLDNGRSAVVRINDRGPFVRGRVIDLSHAAAKKIGLTGLAPVRVEVLNKKSAKRPRAS